MSTVINCKKDNLKKLGYKDLEDCLKDTNNVYIGRHCAYVKGANQSIFANKFSINNYGRDKCLELYEQYLRNNDVLMKEILKLKGKQLLCWCKPERCHGDIIIKILNELDNKL